MQRPIHARSTRNPAVPHQASAAQSAFLSEVHDDMNVSDELSRHPRSWPGVGEPKQNRTSSNVRRESLPEGSEKRLLAVPEGFHSLDSAVAATSSPPAPVACGHSGGLLQWGRRPRATESCERPRARNPAVPASMGHNSVLRAKHGGPLAEIMMSAVNRPPLVATIGKQAPWMMTWRTVGGMERNLRCSARAKAQSRARQRE